jgi:superfamily II DNA or RNA helicase
MAISLFPYQRTAVDAVMQAYQAGTRRPALSVSTGGGKTIMFAKVIEELNERSLVIAHRQEIITQARDKIGMIMPVEDVGIVMANRNDAQHPVVVASVQTISNRKRLEQLGEFGLIVIDEAHHAASPSYVTALNRLGAGATGSVRTLGVSATWDRADGKGLDHVFDQIVYEIRIEELIGAGYLADIRPYRVQTDLDLTGLKVGASGDYSDDDLADRMRQDEQMPWAVADAISQYGNGRHVLTFAPRVDIAEQHRDAIRASGMTAELVHGGTPASERADIIRRMKAGTLQVICNCGVFTEGTDPPIVDCIVMARPTRSRALYQQMLGRGLRTWPNKADCIVLDMIGVTGSLEVQTAASLFGDGTLDDGKSVKASVSKKTEDFRTQERATLASRKDIQLNARAVALQGFDRSRLNWNQPDTDTFALSAGDVQYIIKPHQKNSDFFDLIEFGKDRSRNVLMENVDVGTAQTVSEDRVMNSEASILANKSASWRYRGKKEPATEKQLKMLRWLKISHDPAITKTDASDLISEGQARRALRRA